MLVKHDLLNHCGLALTFNLPGAQAGRRDLEKAVVDARYRVGWQWPSLVIDEMIVAA